MFPTNVLARFTIRDGLNSVIRWAFGPNPYP